MEFEELVKAVLALDYKQRDKLLAKVTESIRQVNQGRANFRRAIDEIYLNCTHALIEIPKAKEAYRLASYRFKSLEIIDEKAAKTRYNEVCKAYETLNNRLDYARFAIKSNLSEWLKLVSRLHRSEYKEEFARQPGGSRFDENMQKIEVYPWWNDLSTIRLKAKECEKLAKSELKLFGNVTELYYKLDELLSSQGAPASNDQAAGFDYSKFEDKTLTPELIYIPEKRDKND